MNPEAFKISFAVDNDFIILNWKRLPNVPETMAMSRYPELEMKFNYRDIANDTVVAMLRDMEIPDSLSKAIMTRIAANAA